MTGRPPGATCEMVAVPDPAEVAAANPIHDDKATGYGYAGAALDPYQLEHFGWSRAEQAAKLMVCIVHFTSSRTSVGS